MLFLWRLQYFSFLFNYFSVFTRSRRSSTWSSSDLHSIIFINIEHFNIKRIQYAMYYCNNSHLLYYNSHFSLVSLALTVRVSWELDHMVEHLYQCMQHSVCHSIVHLYGHLYTTCDMYHTKWTIEFKHMVHIIWTILYIIWSIYYECCAAQAYQLTWI